MSTETNYYKLLGVSKTASADEIRTAYRKQAKKYHPDAIVGDSTATLQLAKVQEAYEILSDAEKRKNYDQIDAVDVDGRIQIEVVQCMQGEEIAGEESIAIWAIHRRLYEWILGFAATKFALFTLFSISIIEAFMPFVPPDVLLIPMCVKKRSKAAYFAIVATVGSVLGALVGYFIIASLMASGAEWMLGTDKIEMIVSEFEKRGSAYVFIAALTPVPFFALTTAAGIAKLNFGVFLAACIIGRSLRYGLEALFTFWIGQKAKVFIDKWFNAITIIACVVVLFGWFMSTKL